jgi:hypothetical protein
MDRTLNVTEEPPPARGGEPSWRKACFDVESLRPHLVAIFVIEAIVLCLGALPRRLSFGSHLFSDPAETLGIQYLLTHGFILNRDFGYQYGLLGLLVDRLWFGLLPATDLSVQPISILVDALLAIGLARFARNLKIGALGIALLFLMLPFAIQVDNPMFSLEGALLANGLAEQAGGRRDKALAFAAASCLAKPVMGYFYGLILVLLVVGDLLCREAFTPKGFLRALAPAATTAVTLAFLLGATFGAHAVISTLVPLRGIAAYKAFGYGHISSDFLYFPGVRIGYYFGTVTAFWLVASLWLVFAGILSAVVLFSLSHDSHSDGSMINHEIVFTCAALHVLFVTCFYGAPSSWAYYFFILLMGVAAASAYSRVGAYLAPSLILLALVADFVLVRGMFREWKLVQPSADTAGLWAPPQERAEWLRVQEFVARGRATFLVGICGGELLSDHLEKPVAAFLVPGVAIPVEVARKARQVEEADFVVMPTVASAGADPATLFRMQPEFTRIFDGFHAIWTGRYFRVYTNGHKESLLNQAHPTSPSGSHLQSDVL